jgi:adenine-specific DNA methylase
MIVCTAARMYDYNENIYTDNLWLLIKIAQWNKVTFVVCRSKALRHKLLFDYAQVV